MYGVMLTAVADTPGDDPKDPLCEAATPVYTFPITSQHSLIFFLKDANAKKAELYVNDALIATCGPEFDSADIPAGDHTIECIRLNFLGDELFHAGLLPRANIRVVVTLADDDAVDVAVDAVGAFPSIVLGEVDGPVYDGADYYESKVVVRGKDGPCDRILLYMPDRCGFRRAS